MYVNKTYILVLVWILSKSFVKIWMRRSDRWQLSSSIDLELSALGYSTGFALYVNQRLVKILDINYILQYDIWDFLILFFFFK